MTIINKKKIDHLYTYEIEDKFFEKRIKIFSKKNNLKYTIIESPMFINSRTEFETYLKWPLY
jgi:deoxyribodipyrimidine photolyase-related protein